MGQDKLNKPYKIPNSTQFMAIGGGKGGIGKSFVSSNLAIGLANQGYKTCLIDLDIGASNVPTLLGENPIVNKTLDDFLKVPSVNIREVLQSSTQAKGLYYLSSHDLTLINENKLTPFELQKLLTALSSPFFHYVIFDLAAGTNAITTEIFLRAQHKFLVTTPDPSAIENFYAFLRRSFQELLRNTLSPQEFALAASVKEKTPTLWMSNIKDKSPETYVKAKNALQTLKTHIIINQCRLKEDEDLLTSIQQVCNAHFEFDFNALGCISYSDDVWIALRNRLPLMLQPGHSTPKTQLIDIFAKWLNPVKVVNQIQRA